MNKCQLNHHPVGMDQYGPMGMRHGSLATFDLGPMLPVLDRACSKGAEAEDAVPAQVITSATQLGGSLAG